MNVLGIDVPTDSDSPKRPGAVRLTGSKTGLRRTEAGADYNAHIIRPTVLTDSESSLAGFFAACPIMAEFEFRPLAKQSIEFIFYNAVALAHTGLEPFAIQDSDMASAVVNQASVLQVPRCYRDALAACPEHSRDEFLGHEQFRTLFAIMAEKQPAAEALFQGVQAVADCGL